MSEIKLPFTQTVGMIIAAATIIIALGGYILYFNSLSRLKAQVKTVEEIKEKYSLSDKMLSDMKTKYDNVYGDMQKIMDELQTAKQRAQDCQLKLNSLENNYDALTRKNELSAPATTATPPAGTAPATPSSTTATPTTPPTSSTPSTPTAAKGLQCPSIETVTSKANAGSWEENKLNWWVDFSSRPLNEGERVGALSKILFDGKNIACYYALGIDNQQSWIVIKGHSKEATLKVTQGEGWSACPNQECQAMCDKDNLSRCFFTLQN